MFFQKEVPLHDDALRIECGIYVRFRGLVCIWRSALHPYNMVRNSLRVSTIDKSSFPYCGIVALRWIEFARIKCNGCTFLHD